MKFISNLAVCSLALALGAWSAQAQQSPAAPRTATAQPLLEANLTLSGRAVASYSARISPRISGHLTKLGTDDQGRPLDAGMAITKGQTLFVLEPNSFENNLALAKAQLAAAQANLDNLTAKTRPEKLEQLRQGIAEFKARVEDKKREVVRYRRLVEQEQTLPPRRLEESQTDLAAQTAQLQAAESRLTEADNGPTPSEIAVAQARVNEAQVGVKIAQTDLSDATVTSPFDGVIIKRFKSLGDYIAANPPTDVFEIQAVGSLEAALQAPETYLPQIAAGKTSITLLSPLLEQPLDLKVDRIVPSIDSARGTVELRVGIPAERRGKLVPGAFLTARLAADPKDGARTIIPQSALIRQGAQDVVYIQQAGKPTTAPVHVVELLTEGAVVRGLAAGQTVYLDKPAETTPAR